MSKCKKNYVGSIVRRGIVYSWRFKTISGKYTVQALRTFDGNVITRKNEAEARCVELSKELNVLHAVNNKVEYLSKVAEAKKIITVQNATLDEIWNKFLGNINRPDSGKATLANYQLTLNWFLAFLKNKKISLLKNITIELAEEYMAHVWSKGVAGRTYNRTLHALKLIFKTISDNSPFALIKTKLNEPESRKPFSQEQIKAIFRTINNSKFHIMNRDEIRIMLMLSLAFGLRLHDAACFRWNYIDMEKGIAAFVPSKTRRRCNIEIILPVPAILLNEFSKALVWKKDEYLLPNTASRYQYNACGISHDITRLLEDSGIKTREEPAEGVRRAIYTSSRGEVKRHNIVRYGFHSFRHTFCTMTANAGKDLSLIQSIAGHSSVTMTQHYAHYNLEAKRSAINVIPLECTSEISEEKGNGTIRLDEAIAHASTEATVSMCNYLEKNLTSCQKGELVALLKA